MFYFRLPLPLFISLMVSAKHSIEICSVAATYRTPTFAHGLPASRINPSSVEFMLPLNEMYLGVDVMRELEGLI